ncbi:spore germination protein [Radiobacillus kanasensis]|uniref:spore germination protein n=1 Tax=Radiobacillus kanasensis TaxID=2844358 RepID=UPI001E319B7D|nr:spore germination protein [Radiobacillus kanasensis]UFU00552.1 spore germination protein [Radiobacillus kanasensis]
MSFGVDPIGVNIIGGIKVNALENTASIGIGENQYMSLNSQVKNNLNAGEVYGDFDYNYFQIIGSSVFDPDGADTVMPVNTPSLGLED